jgi:hypothetical protein
VLALKAIAEWNIISKLFAARQARQQAEASQDGVDAI